MPEMNVWPRAPLFCSHAPAPAQSHHIPNSLHSSLIVISQAMTKEQLLGSWHLAFPLSILDLWQLVDQGPLAFLCFPSVPVL